MQLLYKQIGSTDYTLVGLPASPLEPFDFEKIMNNMKSRIFVQFEDQVVPVEKQDIETLAVFLSIFHNNTVTKNDEV